MTQQLLLPLTASLPVGVFSMREIISSKALATFSL